MDGTLFVKTAPAVTTPPDYPDIWIVGFSYASDKAMVTHGLKYNYRPDVCFRLYFLDMMYVSFKAHVLIHS